MREFLLALLARTPAHGYVLKQAYDALFAEVWRPINIGQIYTTLARAERDGLVQVTEVAQATRPEKKVYALTELGEKEVTAWLSTAAPGVPPRPELVLRLIAADATGIVALGELVARQRAELLSALRQLETLARQPETGDGLVRRLLVEGTALHVQADLQWLECCEEALHERSTRPAPGDTT